MSDMNETRQSKAFHAPGWLEFANTPVIDGKYTDRDTGATLNAEGAQYSGPPAVDLVIMNLHADTAGVVARAQRAVPVETLLCQIMRVIDSRQLQIDSLNATPYAVRIVLSHELEGHELRDIVAKMWDV